MAGKAYGRGSAMGAARTGGIRFVATFVLVGATGAGAYVVLSVLIHSFGVEPWISSVASYAMLIPLVYFAQRGFTFRSKGSHLSSFPKYVATQLIGVALSATLPDLLVRETGLPAIVVFATVAIAIAIVNLLLLMFWTFAD